MRFPAQATIAGLSLSLTAGTAWGADVCARASDVVALQVAALQQQLMVAALTCDDVSLYNSFVITYQQDLVASDEKLQAFFAGLGEAEGATAYHAFKTKMANMYSARSATDKRRFCASVRASFAPALKAEKLNLASFALSQPSFVNEPYTSCGDSVAGGAMVARTPAPAAPTGNVLTAQNAAQDARAAAAGDKPLSAALLAESAKAPAAAGTVAAAGANTPAPSGSQAVNPNSNQRVDATRSAQNPYAYSGQGNAVQAYRERLAQQRVAQQQRAAQQRAAQQRAAQAARARYREPYEGRGYFWPADRYWQFCYTRYGERLPCAEAAQRFRSNRFYYRAPSDAWGYYPGR